MKALIIDDEPMPAKHLREMIRQFCFEIEEVNIIQSPIEAMKHLNEVEYDILFLDVEMPEMNGVEFLKKIQLPKRTKIIFSTAYSDYAVDAFKANATHYLLKPIEEKELVFAVRKVLSLSDKNVEIPRDEKLMVFDGEEYLVVEPSEIYYLKAEGSYTQFILKGKEILASKRMGHFEEKLNANHFIRCHHSFLVNGKQIDKIGKHKNPYLIMKNGDTIPVSASKREELESRLGLR